MPKLHFQVRTWEDGTYGFARYRIWDAKPRDSFSHDPVLEIRFQRTISDTEPHWYGVSLTPGRTNTLEGLELAVRLARRIDKALAKAGHYYIHFETNPSQVLDALELLRAVQVVYDARTSHHEPLASIMPDYIGTWRDDWRAMGKPNCMGSCLAGDEREAKRLIGADLGQGAVGGYNAEELREYLPRWLAAGSPVIRLDREMPDVRPAREIIAL